MVNIFANQFSKASQSSKYVLDLITFFAKHTTDLDQTAHSLQEHDDLPFNQPFSQEEFNNALVRRKSTAPGQDEIYYEMIYNLRPACQTELLRILNSSWRQGHCPTSWRHSIIVPLLKYEKPDQLLPTYKSYQRVM